MKSSEALKDVLSLLDDGQAWTKGHFAVDKDGVEVNTDSPIATKFCITGAVRRIDHCDSNARTYLHRALVDQKVETASITVFNDLPKTEFKDIKELIDKATEQALATGD